MLDRATELRGLQVASSDRGELLGSVARVHLDPESKCVSAIVYAHRKHLGIEEFFVPAEDVRVLGRDLVLIRSAEAAHRLTQETPPPGRSVADLQGAWVTTLQGMHLGTLVDVELCEEGWWITELILAEEKRLPVERDEIRIGDEILVPAVYAERIVDLGGERRGFLRRVFGSEALEGTKQALRRALRRSKEPEEGAGV